MPPAPPLARYAVLGTVVLAALAAVASWLVRERHVSPFGPLGRALRRGSDVLLNPVERRLHRLGGNPQHAGWWLVVGVAVIGLVLLALAGWAANEWLAVRVAAGAGPWTVVRFAVVTAWDVLFLAILVRVVASWLGLFRYNRWMRPAYWLTDWLIEPIRRALPAVGMFDLSPLVALVALWLLKSILLSALPI